MIIPYINENRLRSVLSKWGDDVKQSDKGKLIGLFIYNYLYDYIIL